jgi:ATP-binding cassette subfamily B protein
MDSFKWIWKYLKKFKFLFLTALGLAGAVVLLGMVNPYIQGRIVDEVIGSKKTDLLFPLMAIMVGATLLKVIIRYIYLLSFEHISQSSVLNIRKEIYSKVQLLDFSYFDKTKTGDIMARMTGDLEAVRHFTSWVIFAVFFNVFTFITVMLILFTIDLKFTLILLAISPVIGVLTYKLASVVKPAFSSIREQFARLNSVVQENISGNRVVKAFAKEDYEIVKFSKENEEFRQKNIDAAKIWERYLPVLDSLAGILSVVVILVGGAMVINKSLTLGELVTFNGYIWALNGPMRNAGWIVNDIQRFAASADKIRGILNTESQVINPEKPVKLYIFRGAVEFRNVGFSYGDERTLQSISFKTVPGQTIAIVGPTGSGKSTLISLISRFYDCDNGEVLIDGVNVKNIDLKQLRQNIGGAMQDIFLFSDTIEGNIAYGVPDATLEQVVWAAQVADAHDFITAFPEGYDTIIGERGVGLSGGQKQRIALARALLKNPPILILDDTTSSVDIETEHKIHSTLKSFYEGKTTFVIAHRISSVKNADMILVLDGGKIVERGRHEELLEMKGYYYSIFTNQYGDFDKMYKKKEVV